MSIVFFVLLPIIYLLLRYFPVILDWNKKLSSIPTLPRRLPIFGHALKILKMQILENCSPCHALFTVIDKNIPVGKDDDGVFALHTPIMPIISITSPEAAEIIAMKEQMTGLNYNFMKMVVGNAVGNVLPLLRSGFEHSYHQKTIHPYRRQVILTVPERVKKHFYRFTEAIGEDGIIEDLYTTSQAFVEAYASEALTRIPMSWENRFERWKDADARFDFIKSSFWLVVTWLTGFSSGRRSDVFARIVEEAIAKFDTEDGDGNVKDRQPTVLNLLIGEHLKNPERFTLQDVKDEFFAEYFASLYSTTFTLMFVLHELGHRPDIQDKILEELKNVLSPGQELTLDDMDKLPYLEAVVKESIRRHPTVPSIPPWMTLADIDIKTDDRIITIPRLSIITTKVRNINHNPRHWKDPEEFNPNRFLNETEVASRHPLAFYSFSSGNKTCPGKKIALVTQQLILAQIIQRFTVQSLNPLEPISLNYSIPIICVPLQKVSVRFTNRDIN